MRQRADAPVRAVDEAHLLEDALDANLGMAYAVQFRVESQVFAAGQIAVQQGLVTDKANQGPRAAAGTPHPQAGDVRLTRVRARQARQDPEQSGFPRPVRSEEHRDLAPGHGDVNAPQDAPVAVVLAETNRRDG